MLYYYKSYSFLIIQLKRKIDCKFHIRFIHHDKIYNFYSFPHKDNIYILRVRYNYYKNLLLLKEYRMNKNIDYQFDLKLKEDSKNSIIINYYYMYNSYNHNHIFHKFILTKLRSENMILGKKSSKYHFLNQCYYFSINNILNS